MNSDSIQIGSSTATDTESEPADRSHRSRLAFTAAILLALGSAASGSALPCEVPSAGYPKIDDAIADPTCDPITVAAGTYTENLVISRSLNLQGAGVTTVIHGGASGRTIEVNGGAAVVVRIDSVRITGGNATGQLPEVDVGGSIGGGILVHDLATVEIVDAQVDGNVAKRNVDGPGVGGGIGVAGGGVLMATNVDILDNIGREGSGWGAGSGGGVGVLDGTLDLVDCRLMNNIALEGGDGPNAKARGGAVYVGQDEVSGETDQIAIASLTRCLIEKNAARQGNGSKLAWGGGMYAGRTSDTELTLTDNTWHSNIAGDSDRDRADFGPGRGGGLAVEGSSDTAPAILLSIDGDTFDSNIASKGEDDGFGGGIWLSAGGTQGPIHATLTDVDLTNNIAKAFLRATSMGFGGGLFAEFADITYLGGTIVGNRAATSGAGPGEGGGLYLSASPFDGDRLDIRDNMAQATLGGRGTGGGVAVWGASGQSSSFTLTNSFVTDNVSADPTSSRRVGGGIYIHDGGSNLHKLDHITVSNEIFTDETGIDGGFNVAPGGIEISNSIISNFRTGIGSSFFAILSEDYNLFFNNTDDTAPSLVTSGGSSIYGDPHFVSPADRDYHITELSAAIDLAVLSSEPFDYDGQARPDPASLGPDAGADELYVPGLAVSILAASIPEAGGAGATTATVTRNTNTADPLEVTLSSSDTSEATVPAAVTIPAGASTSAPFSIDAVDDAIADGTKSVVITAEATGHTTGTATVDVIDDEVASLTLTPAALSFAETDGAGATTATVSRNSDTTAPLVVMLSSSDTSEATVPAAVTIPAGASTSAPFAINAVDDPMADGTKSVTLTAEATGHAAGTATVDVIDDEVPTLTLTLAAGSFAEEDGAGATTATVSRNTDTTDPLVVTLTSSDTSEATVPVSVTIAAGAVTSPPFDIDAVDDPIVDGTQTVTLTATAGGHDDGTETVDVIDGESAIFSDGFESGDTSAW